MSENPELSPGTWSLGGRVRSPFAAVLLATEKALNGTAVDPDHLSALKALQISPGKHHAHGGAGDPKEPHDFRAVQSRIHRDSLHCSRLRLTADHNLGILALLRTSGIISTILQKTAAPEPAWQWLPMRLPIAYRRAMARALGMAAERRNSLYLEWDSTTGRVRSVVWQKRTRERVLTAKRAGLQPEELLGYSTTDLIRERAADWGIGPFVLYRLLVQASPSISQRTVLQLRRKLEPDEYRAVLSAISPQIIRTWNLYVATINRELARLAGGPGRRSKHEFDFDELPVEEQRLRKRFDGARVAAGLPVPRSLLAVHRVYDPVLPWRQASLSPRGAERLQILRFGWRREHSLIRFEEAALRRVLRQPAIGGSLSALGTTGP